MRVYLRQHYHAYIGYIKNSYSLSPIYIWFDLSFSRHALLLPFIEFNICGAQDTRVRFGCLVTTWRSYPSTAFITIITFSREATHTNYRALYMISFYIARIYVSQQRFIRQWMPSRITHSIKRGKLPYYWDKNMVAYPMLEAINLCHSNY